jgi:2-phosphosulfolactate phosphatase
VRVDVALTAGQVPAEGSHLDHVVVIDVLRATSTIVTALAAGADGVRPEGTVHQALERARALGALLGGERDGLPPEGFDLGNSPASYDAESCGGRHVVLTTTNGTQAVLAVRGARCVMTGALVNAEAVGRTLADRSPEHVLLVCAGTRGRVAADDVAGAGAIAGTLALQAGARFGDGARVAAALFDAWKHDLPSLLARCEAGVKLAGLGLEADLSDCARVDSVPVVAALDGEGVFRLVNGA